MSTDQSVVMLCGRGVKAGMVLSTCGWQVKVCDRGITQFYTVESQDHYTGLTRANLSALEMSIAHVIKRYTNVLFTLHDCNSY